MGRVTYFSTISCLFTMRWLTFRLFLWLVHKMSPGDNLSPVQATFLSPGDILSSSLQSLLELFTFLPRDASAERGNATVSRPSVCLSVCPSVCDV